MTSEAPRVIAAVGDLKRDTCLLKLEEATSEPLSDRNSEFFSAILEASENDPASDRKSMFFSRKLDAEPIESVKDRNSEFFSAKSDDGFSEAVSIFVIAFAMDPERASVSLRYLK